ncbi:MAG: hypothetical protein AAB583_01720 [Patescibacteria group bacterium]
MDKETQSSMSEKRRKRANLLQNIAATSSAMLFLAAACGIPAEGKSSNEPTPQPIPTPPTLNITDCEPFMIPDWQKHNQIEFACPQKSGDPSERTNVVLDREKNGTVSIRTSTFGLGQSEEPSIPDNVLLYPGGRIRFQSPADYNCNIVVLFAKDQVPSVSQECPK